MSEKKIYCVSIKVENVLGPLVASETFLVRATSRAKAERYVVRHSVTTNLASQDDLVKLVAGGAVVKEAEGEPNVI